MSPFNRVVTLMVCLAITAALSYTNVRAETVDRIVANVNGEIILYSDLRRQIESLKKSMPMLDLADATKKTQIERDVLNRIIQQKLADMEAERLKVTVSNPEIDLRLQQIAEQNHTTIAQMELTIISNGETMEKFREQIKKEMERDRLVERVLKSKIFIGDDEVDSFLKGISGDSVSATQKVHLGMIALPVGDKFGKPADVEKTGREILAKLKTGADFSAMAKQYSKGSAAESGGDMGYVALDDITPYIAQGIRGLEKDQVSDLVEGPGGFYILKVYDITVTRLQKTDPILREKVRRLLYDREVNRKFDEWVHSLESKAFIQISF